MEPCQKHSGHLNLYCDCNRQPSKTSTPSTNTFSTIILSSRNVSLGILSKTGKLLRDPEFYRRFIICIVVILAICAPPFAVAYSLGGQNTSSPLPVNISTSMPASSPAWEPFVQMQPRPKTIKDMHDQIVSEKKEQKIRQAIHEKKTAAVSTQARSPAISLDSRDAEAIYQEGAAKRDERLKVHGRKDDDIHPNFIHAFKCFAEAAAKGHAQAMFSLGIAYEYGRGTKEDQSKALEWYIRSAEHGNIDVMGQIGTCYHLGKGTPNGQIDVVEAYKWYRRLKWHSPKNDNGAPRELPKCPEDVKETNVFVRALIYLKSIFGEETNSILDSLMSLAKSDSEESLYIQASLLYLETTYDFPHLQPARWDKLFDLFNQNPDTFVIWIRDQELHERMRVDLTKNLNDLSDDLNNFKNQFIRYIKAKAPDLNIDELIELQFTINDFLMLMNSRVKKPFSTVI